MFRFILPALALTLCLPSHAASLKDFELQQKLQKVAQESSKGTPRAVNADILDYGYQVQGTELINRLGVRAEHAAQMRAHPDSMRIQLGNSVCSNPGYVRLLTQGATLLYEFRELDNDLLVSRERFSVNDCVASTD